MSNRYRVEAMVQLAHFLKEKEGGSIKSIRRSLEKNCCRVNGQIERFGSRWLEKGSVVEYTPLKEEKIQIETLFEDEELKIVDKPPGFVSSQESCTKAFGRGVFLVHRLDKDTSGAFLLAKSKEVKNELIELFSKFKIEKEYLAIVDGTPQKSEGIIDTFLSKKRTYQGGAIWGASKSGQRAITKYRVLKKGAGVTLVLAKPITGRTHQIRVHMAGLGCPILGDRQYAHHFRSKLFASRPLLHAYRLVFSFRGKEIAVCCSLPKDFPMHP